MCEYADGCDVVTDPLADALSKQKGTDADLLVLAPTCHQLLAAVHRFPDGRRMLTRPYIPIGPGPSVTHVHPMLESLSSLDPDEVLYGRCKHGTWNFRPRQIVDQLAAHDEGRVLPQGELVKVEHPSGQVTKMAQAFAESHGLKIVGRVDRSRRLLRPYVLASYVAWPEAPEAE